MKEQINEIKRMQFLAGLLKENQYDSMYKLPNNKNVSIVDSSIVDDIFYGTSWAQTFNKRLLKQLLTSKNLFVTKIGGFGQKYLIYIDGNDITVLDVNSEIVDHEKNKELNNAVNSIIDYKTA